MSIQLLKYQNFFIKNTVKSVFHSNYYTLNRLGIYVFLYGQHLSHIYLNKIYSQHLFLLSLVNVFTKYGERIDVYPDDKNEILAARRMLKLNLCGRR